MAKIEFATMVKERTFNVGLQDICTGAAIIIGLLFSNAILDFLKTSAILDVSTTVAQLSWFYYPAVAAFFALLIELP